MIIAVTSMGPSQDATFDVHFGRSPYFVIFDSETGEVIKDYDNTINLQAVQGSGVESAKVLIDLDVEVLLTGHVGPKALDVLKLGDISAYKVDATLVKDALSKYKEKSVSAIYEADVRGHWA